MLAAVARVESTSLRMATLFYYLFVRKQTLATRTLSFQDMGLQIRGCLCSRRDSESPESTSGGEEEDGEEKELLVHVSGVYSFSWEELLRGSAYVLGKSGHRGIVYKAVLDNGVVVAVRRLGAGGEKKQKEFEAQVKSIAHVRHPNVVCLHSFSWTAEEKLLVYEYLGNGTLEMALHGRSEGSKGFLTWEARLQIAQGFAQGLAHIHECSPKNYVHGDIKPGNILLNSFLEARVADFGLQRLLALVEPESFEFGSTTANSVYQAPGAMNAKKLTQKSDVYSFGVVLLELLTGRSPVEQLAAGDLDLVSWIHAALQKKKALSEIVDPCLLEGSNEQNKMVETLQIALACIAVNPESRPKMKQVSKLFELLVNS